MFGRARTPVTFVFRSPIARAELPGLFVRACETLACSGRAAAVLCDVRDARADAVTVDALAQLQLAAGRFGRQVRIRGASDELRDLIAFMGLENVLFE